MAGRYAASELTDATHTPHVGRHADIKPSGRRRAIEDAPDHPANTGPLHRKGKKRVSGVALGFAATGAMSLAAGAIPLHTDMTPVVHQGLIVDGDPAQPITAATTVAIAQPKVEVSTVPAPPPEPVAIVEAPPPAPAPKIEYTPAPPPPPVPVVVVPPPPPQPPQSAGAATRQAIINAAYGQLGWTQDCTMLVTNSLRAVGIYHHGWPISYFNLGYQVSRLDALPGDLVYYVNGGSGWAHIAVYAGNGRAVHGGFNGNQTVEFSVDVGSGPVFIRVT